MDAEDTRDTEEPGLPATSYEPSLETDSQIPVQIEVAFEVLRWVGGIENNRDLTSKEKAVYESGLEVLRLYLSGEMTFDELDAQREPKDA